MSDFPMNFPKCNNCGSEKTVAKSAFDEEIENGNKLIPHLPIRCLDQETRLLQDPKTAKFVMPILVLFWDICAGCGMRRLTRVEKQTIPVNTETTLPPRKLGRN